MESIKYIKIKSKFCSETADLLAPFVVTCNKEEPASWYQKESR